MIRRALLFLPILAVVACGGGTPASDAGPDLGPTDLGPADLGTNAHFRAGPYGTTPGTVAGPFSAPTTDGTLDFAATFDGTDSWIFVIFAQGDPYGMNLWTSSIDDLLTAANGTHTQFVIMSFVNSDMSDHAMEHVVDFQTRADAAIAAAAPAVQTWATGRFHYVTSPANRLPDWIGAYLNTPTSPISFAIDHAQVIRQVGLLSDPTSPTAAHIANLAYEAEAFDFEAARDAALALEMHPTIVPVATSMTVTGGDVDLSVTLPDATTVGSFDKMEVDIAFTCQDHLDVHCSELDQLGSLSVCHDVSAPSDAGVGDGGVTDAAAPADAGPTGTVCDEEITRFVTPYGREGRWVVDVSPTLAFLVGGGARTFRLNAGTATAGKPYIVDISLRMSNTRSSQHPVTAIRLWDGNVFDASYNGLYAPVMFTVPTGIRKVELYAVVTGSGLGTESHDCAELCDHQHHFTLNGTEHLLDFNQAGFPTGCVPDVMRGAVPNQYGFWTVGRGGWCPGNAVTPLRADVTAELDVHGGANTITYSATVAGAPFNPTFFTMPMAGSSRPAIDMQSWLVYWR